MSDRHRVLFVCTHNSARSQIAEAYLRKYGGETFEVESAGLEPGTLNPFVVRALLEKNIDIRDKRPQSVFDLWKSGRVYHYVITVCDREAEEQCPVFPGLVVRRSWPFRDPAKFAGSESEIMDQVREVREQIRKRVIAFLGEFVPVAELANEYRE